MDISVLIRLVPVSDISFVLMTLVVHYGFLILLFALVKPAVTRMAVRSGDVAHAQSAFEEQDINIGYPPTVLLKCLFRITLMLKEGCATQPFVLFCIRSLTPCIVDSVVPFLLVQLGSIYEKGIYLLSCLFSYVCLRFRTNGCWFSTLRDNVRAMLTDYRFYDETIGRPNCKEHKSERHHASVRKYQRLRYRVDRRMNRFNLVQNLVITVGLLIVFMTVTQGIRVANGQLEPRNLASIALHSQFNLLGDVFRPGTRSLLDTRNMPTVLNESTDVVDKPGAPGLVAFDGEIEIDTVRLTYNDRRPLLRGGTVHVLKRISIALDRESGEETLVALRLPHQFDHSKEGDGRILVDGQDIHDVTQANLYNAIGVIAQDDHNFGHGKCESTQGELGDTAEATQTHNRNTSFPDTKVSDRGIQPSRGEKQRVSIPRTLHRDPPKLLLDEATGALNTRDIKIPLKNSIRGQTFIAHMPSTIAKVDSILGVKYGQISPTGGLLVNGGIMEVVCRFQIGDTTPGPFEGSITQAIDPALPHDTGESLAAASEVVVAGIPSTSVPATGPPSDGATWDIIPEAAASNASRSNEVHPVAFSTTQASDTMVPEEQHESCPDPSSWSEFHQQARGTSGPPPRSGFVLFQGIFRRDTSSGPARPSTHRNVVSTLMGVVRGVRVPWRKVKAKTEGMFQANSR